jgi:predicted nucleic acid-binding protein
VNAIPGGPVLFDTSAYIRQIREQAYPWLARDRKLFQRSVLSVVVASELYAGTRSVEDKRALDGLCGAHRALGNLSCPGEDLWLQAGTLIRRYSRLRGEVRLSDHFRDVLIALEAVKNGATLMTENAQDFHRWQGLLRGAGQRLRVFDLRALKWVRTYGKGEDAARHTQGC